MYVCMCVGQSVWMEAVSSELSRGGKSSVSIPLESFAADESHWQVCFLMPLHTYMPSILLCCAFLIITAADSEDRIQAKQEHNLESVGAFRHPL